MQHLKNLVFIITLLLISNNSLAGPNLFNPQQSSINQTTTKNIFILKTNAQSGVLKLNWQIAADHFLYRDKIKVIVVDNNTDLSKHISFPKHKILRDPVLNEDIAVYSRELKLALDLSKILTNSINNEKDNIDIKVTYQGCSADGFCYSPQTKVINIDKSSLSKKLDNEHSSNESNYGRMATKNPSNSYSRSEILDRNKQEKSLQYSEKNIKAQKDSTNIISSKSQTYFQKLIANSDYLAIFIAFFSFGLLLAFTPCVLPMIPIILSIIVGRTDLISKTRSFILASTYVLTMSISYAAIGLLAGTIGYNAQLSLQNPTTITLVSIFIILLGLNLLEIIQIKLPINVNKQIYKLEKKQGHGSIINAIVLGLLATLVITPCITPALAGAVTFLTEQGSPIRGGIALFAMGLGIGAPLILFAIGGSHLLPTSGNWAKTLKRFTGFIVIGLGIWILDRVLDESIIDKLWGSLLIAIAFFVYQIKINKSPINNNNLIYTIKNLVKYLLYY